MNFGLPRVHLQLDDSFSPSIPIAKSSGLPFFTRRQYTSAISSTFTSSLQSLITGIPDKTHCDLLINDFFEHENWFYGLPKKLILCVYNGMWDTIRADLTSVHRINFHWLTLLFMLFALSPACGSEEESRRYFLQALLGKRLAEDLLSASFMSPRDSSLSSEGTAHGCIAASMISRYMCDRGQMTEVYIVYLNDTDRHDRYLTTIIGLESNWSCLTQRSEFWISSQSSLG